MKQETSSPYLNARRVENDRTADIMGRCRLWQAVALLALLLAVGGMGGVLHLAARSQFVPYVVEVDRLGQTRGAGRADRAAAAKLLLHYPPAKTRLVLLAGDGFGRELLQILREEGYAVNENRGNEITIGYVVDQQPDGDILLRLYLGDSVMLSRLYRLNPPGHGRVCFPVGAWSRRETEGVEGDA